VVILRAMKVFQADEANTVLRYAFVPINVDDHVQLLYYIQLVLPDYEVFDLMWQELRKFHLDILRIAEQSNFCMMDELHIAMSIEDSVRSSNSFY
jgi:hypothetical protein